MDVAARVPGFKVPGKDELSRVLRDVSDFRAPGQYVLQPWLAAQAADLAAAGAKPQAPSPAGTSGADNSDPAGAAQAPASADVPAPRTLQRVPGNDDGAALPARAPAGAARLGERKRGGAKEGPGRVMAPPAMAGTGAGSAGAPAASKKEKKRKRLVRLGEAGAAAGESGAKHGRVELPPSSPTPHPSEQPQEAPSRRVAPAGAAGAAAGATDSGRDPGGHPGGNPVGGPAGDPAVALGLCSARSASSSDYDASWFALHEGRAPVAYAPVASAAQAAGYAREYDAMYGVYFRLHQEIEANRRCGHRALHAGLDLLPQPVVSALLTFLDRHMSTCTHHDKERSWHTLAYFCGQ